MPYAEGRTFYDADSHIMETRGWLTGFADPDVRDRIRPMHLGGAGEATTDYLAAAEARLGDAGLATTGVDDTVCCYAEKTETWVSGPDGTRWEWYVKHGDVEQLVTTVASRSDGSAGNSCCS